MSACSPLRFSEEDAVVLDRWIDAVCGEEMQFPAHRRGQFAAYKQHLEGIRAADGHSLFHQMSRSGTRETLALQNALSVLKQLCRCDMEETEKVRKEIQAVKRTLHERSMAVKEEKMDGSPAPSPQVTSGFNPVPAAESSHDAYESPMKVAERYVAEIDRQRESNRKNMELCHGRKLKLLDQRNRLLEEENALREAEQSVTSQFDETSVALARKRDALALEQAAWKELQQSSTCAEAQGAGNMNAAKDEEEEKKKKEHVYALAEARSLLNEASIKIAQTQAELGYQDGSHAVRFRQARQRLKDWQEMAEQIRRIHDQLQARTRVISMVVEANAVALEAESGLGQLERLRKLNQLLLEKSAKILGLRPEGKEEGGKGIVSSATGRGEGVLRDLFTSRQSVASSVSMTDAASSLSTPRRRSSVSQTTPTVAVTGISFSPVVGDAMSPNAHRSSLEKERRHRQAYALLTDLQRWEMALVKEAAALYGICEKGIGSASATNSSESPNATLQELRSMLLEA
ncbi:hypothetical protein ECC02_002992 [Trypanosoma cruzi]|uniref:Uncharacterized protein n=1 Tax=Trypanosoma cruzi TaxID=5693 RepID=A0A7J6YCH1_TRYCR|nr:hypothetical protein ECC02_002992 [Trypanosoma cruzi]